MLAPPQVNSDSVSDLYLKRFYAAASSLRIELRLVTPEWAAEIMAKNNTRNRKLSIAWVRVKNAILRDAWFPNGEAIVFDTQGVLINGQHRLKAIVESGRTVPCLVVYGIDPEAMATFDQGKKRSAGDVLSMIGHTHAVQIAATLGWQRAWDNGTIDSPSKRTIPNDEVIALANEYADMIDSIKYAAGANNKMIPPGLHGFLHYHFSQQDKALAEKFFERVIDGIGVEKNSHEYNLRRRLENDLSGVRDEKTQIEIAALTISTWIRVRDNEPVPEYIVWRPGKDGVRVFPDFRRKVKSGNTQASGNV